MHLNFLDTNPSMIKSPLASKKIAVVGASGNVGRVILSLLNSKGVQSNNIRVLSSSRSAGEVIEYGSDCLALSSLDGFNFEGTDLAFFAASSEVSKVYVPLAVSKGVIVIDKASLFRMECDVPLIVPEVNGDLLKNPLPRGIVASPNCSTIPLVVALSVFQKLSPLKRVVVSTYQSVSGAGKKGVDELSYQTQDYFKSVGPYPRAFHKPIAFNLIPQIDFFLDNGDTKEEQKMAAETPKILGVPLALTATCVRVPVFVGHSMAVNVECMENIDLPALRQALQNQEGLKVIDNPAKYEYITPLECAGKNEIFLSRLRIDSTRSNTFNFWLACDNLLKGAALNAIQIAERL
jgi:aspartate-semialdehyde dehydrogenase